MSPLAYTLVRSRRRSIALSVARDATRTVRAPLRTPVSFIEAFIEEKLPWVERVMERLRGQSQGVTHRYETGERFWFLGRECSLRVSEEASRSLVFSNGEFLLSKHAHYRARSVFLEWYKREAKKILLERVSFFARENDLEYQSVKINAARTRWGSCSGKGSLNFSFRLVMAPLSVIDYVVVHELSHIEHKNHSRTFWKAVAVMFPGFETERRWLKKNGHLLEC